MSSSSSGMAEPSLRERTFGIAASSRVSKPFGGLLGPVGDDHVRARPADRGQALHDRGLAVDVARGRGGLQHRVLAADAVGGHRQVGGLLDAVQHVEVGERRLDHEHVGALLHVQQRLAHRLVGVGRVHLVAAPVAERGRGVGGLAERPVEGGGVLGRVGDDRRVLEVLGVQLGAQRADAAVHHVAGRHGVGARTRVRDGGLGQQLERQVVVHLAVVAHHAAVAVRGVLAQAHVGDHDELGVGVLERPDGQLDHALVVVGAGRALVLLGRQAEQQHRRHAGGVGGARLLDQVRDRQPVDARHRPDRRALVRAQLHEVGLDQVRRGQLGLADHAAQQAGAAQAPHAGGGEGHRIESRQTGSAPPASGRRSPRTAPAGAAGGSPGRRPRSGQRPGRRARA